MDNDQVIEILLRMIDDLRNDSQQRIEELKQEFEKRASFYEMTIANQDQRIEQLQQRIVELERQRDKSYDRLTQNFYFQGAKIRGGFAARDYTGDIQNIIQKILESEEMNKEDLKALLQQLIDKLEQDNEKSS
jgi:uncharacterized coiled-coil protein SlyX